MTVFLKQLELYLVPTNASRRRCNRSRCCPIVEAALNGVLDQTFKTPGNANPPYEACNGGALHLDCQCSATAVARNATVKVIRPPLLCPVTQLSR